MDLIALSGFFGSGKTTLLLQLARHFILHERRRVYVVQNEIGDVGVDDQRLRAEGLELKELLGGCICCTMQATLVPTLEQIARDKAPDLIILETSGLAQPPLLRAALAGSSLRWRREQLWVVLDSIRLARLQRALALPFVQIAVDSADVIVLNKVDVAGEAAAERLRAEALERNAEAVVVPTALRTAANLPESLRLLAESPPQRRRSCRCGHDHENDHEPNHEHERGEGGHGAHEAHDHHHEADPEVCARQRRLVPPQPIAPERVREAMAGLRDAVEADGAVEIGHLKLFVEGEGGSGVSWSVTRFGEEPTPSEAAFTGAVRALTLNAIVYGRVAGLARHVAQALDRLAVVE